MSGDYTYYDEGFFGFGEAGTFKPYSLMHFAPILICVGLIIFVWYKREWFRNWKYEERFRYVLSFVLFFTEFSFFLWLLYVGDVSGKYQMMSYLPLHVCDLGIILCVFMVTSKNKALFGINFFITLFGATLACIIPQTVLDGVDPTYFRYYQYFGEHLLPIFATAYMMIVHEMRPRYRDIWFAIGSLAAMVIPAVKLNKAFPGADKLFLELSIPHFPENQFLRAGVYMVLLIIFFHLMWKAAQKITERKRSLKSSV